MAIICGYYYRRTKWNEYVFIIDGVWCTYNFICAATLLTIFILDIVIITLDFFK